MFCKTLLNQILSIFLYFPAAAFGGSLTTALAAAAAVCAAAASSGTYEEIDGGGGGDHVLKPSEIMKGRRRRNVEAATEAAYDEAGGKKAVPGGAKPTLPFILPKFPTRPDSTGSSKGQYWAQYIFPLMARVGLFFRHFEKNSRT